MHLYAMLSLVVLLLLRSHHPELIWANMGKLRQFQKIKHNEPSLDHLGIIPYVQGGPPGDK